MNQQQYIELYEKFLSGNCSPEEEEMLTRFSKDFLKNDDWKPEMGEPNEVKVHILNQVNHAIHQPKVFRLYARRWMTAASVVLMLSAAAAWLILNPINRFQTKDKKTVIHVNDQILPGGNKAILTLANGTRVILNKTKNGLITIQGNAQIVKLNNGQITYRQKGTGNSTTLYNTINTPRGGNYNLILADGTKVTLNAESSITFPSNFNGKSREVSITGEAYFEVAKKTNQPFIVSANQTETTVLGTHFDIMAYKDEPITKTTLFEGAVKFSKSKSNVLLKPGQQAVSSNNFEGITVLDANIEEALAWKNGYFFFQDEDIHSIMRKIARWYDVDVVYENINISNLSFGGSVSRYKNIADILNILQSTGTVHFKLDERRVTVMK